MDNPDQKGLDVRFLNDDVLLPFQIETGVLRGRLVRLGPSIDAILRRHAYPDPVAQLLAQTVALAAALGSALKFDGIFTLQAQGDGPVSMLVADVTSNGALRACARFDPERLGQGKPGKTLLGDGQLVFTVDQKLGAARYQGVVALKGESLTEAFQVYFKQSEQIPTGLFSAAEKDETGRWRAGCLFLQRLPREGGEALPQEDTSFEDDWLRTMTLMQSCTTRELVDPSLAPEDLLYRLFHEEGVRVYDKKAFREECRCSRERLLGILSSMSQGEREDMLIQGRAEVSCHFCGKTYVFGKADLEKT